eukprot:scpid43741/ scgid10443/ 
MVNMVYFPNLIDTLMLYLHWYESCSKLVQRDGIPDQEIWLKLGGDHGGGSFKFVMQIANVATPNSLSNTIPLCVFEAQDTPAYLEIALRMYRPDVESLRSTTKWKEHSFRVFFFGDHDFQTKSYGHSGSSGVRPCLHCLCPKRNIDTPPGSHPDGDDEVRTLETLAADHQAFLTAGAVHNRVKDFNNVMRPVIIPVAVADVVVSALHLDLGIFPWLFSFYKTELQRLDIRLASHIQGSGCDQSVFTELASLRSRLRCANEQIATCQSTLQAIQQQLQYNNCSLSTTRQHHEITYK